MQYPHISKNYEWDFSVEFVHVCSVDGSSRTAKAATGLQIHKDVVLYYQNASFDFASVYTVYYLSYLKNKCAQTSRNLSRNLS